MMAMMMTMMMVQSSKLLFLVPCFYDGLCHAKAKPVKKKTELSATICSSTFSSRVDTKANYAAIDN